MISRVTLFRSFLLLAMSFPAYSDTDTSQYEDLSVDLINQIYSFLGQRIKLDQNKFKNYYLEQRFINKYHARKIGSKIDDWFKFKYIEGGIFDMGSPENETGRFVSEIQIFNLSISDFWLQTTPVTQFQYWLVTKVNPSKFNEKKHCPDEHLVLNGLRMCPNHPIERVSWDDAKIFLQSLNKISKEYTYRLPTEAEWEYASRAGTTSRYSFGENEIDLDKYAWYEANSKNHQTHQHQTHQVASLKPNDFGLSDMHGHVWEWVEDNRTDRRDRFEVRYDPVFLDTSKRQVVRGGSFRNAAKGLRSAFRGQFRSNYRDNDSLGFRLVRVRKTLKN